MEAANHPCEAMAMVEVGLLSSHRLWRPHPAADKPRSRVPSSSSSSWKLRCRLHPRSRNQKIPPRFTPPRLHPRLVICAHASASSSSPRIITDVPNTDTKQSQASLKVINGTSNKYRFHEADGGEIQVTVVKNFDSYNVCVTVSPLHDRGALYMHWVAFQSQFSGCNVIDSHDVPTNTSLIGELFQNAFKKTDSGIYILDFNLTSKVAPLYIGFSLSQESSSSSEGAWTRNETDFVFSVGCGRGRPNPFGAVVQRNGSTNFAIYSRFATDVSLCLYNPGSTQPTVELELQTSINKTGNTWHIEVDDIGMFDRYGYRCKGDSSWERGSRFHPRRILVDPYAKVLATFLPGQDDLPCPAKVLGLLPKGELHFDWKDDVSPSIPLEEVVAYRVDVTGFTASKSSGLEENVLGTFQGLSEKVQHFKSLGVNTVILQPIFSFEPKKGPYYPFSFFVPMDIHGPLMTSASSSMSLKKAVQELHKNRIEVILDVIFTHTCENNDAAPDTISFRGIDNATYYILEKNGRIAGSEEETSNCFNCNHPVVQTLILDSLRHWVMEYHVDGFCFVNASALTKGPHGEELSRPLLVEEITFDPILSSCKLFADLSSPFTSVGKELTFPHWKRWCLWNNKYRDDVRQFLRCDKGLLSNFATRLCGSGDILADGRGPSFSFNHITSPYSLTLVDLVSYSENVKNQSERSWNCGEEGPTLNQAVLNIRLRQVRNFLMCLFLSQGIPVLNMGDEYGVSKGGSVSIHRRKVFNWDALNLDFGKQISYLIRSLSAFRSRRHDLFQQKTFIKLENIQWYGLSANQPDWDDEDSSYIGASIRAETTNENGVGEIYVGFNTGGTAALLSLPESSQGMKWFRIADTSLPYPQFFQEAGVPVNAESRHCTYQVEAHSSILLEARIVKESEAAV